MTDHWRTLAGAGDWHLIDWIDLPLDERKALLAAIQKALGRREIKHGKESQWRYRRPEEVEGPLREAACILALGELQASIEMDEGDGYPPKASEVWAEHRAMVEAALDELEAAGEATEGDQELSRAAHIAAAREHLAGIDMTTKWMVAECHDEHEKDWLREVIAEVAFTAFEAGRRVQAAGGKDLEALAVRWDRHRETLRRNATKNETSAILTAMAKYIAGRHSIRNAAKLVHEKDKLGKSADANRKLWARNKKLGQAMLVHGDNAENTGVLGSTVKQEG